jgi:hypothetical protein
MERSTGMRCAYRISIITQIIADPICCRKLTVVRSKCPLRVMAPWTAARSARVSSMAANTKTMKYAAAPMNESGLR